MRKKTSTIIGLAIATILVAYISALTLSNQVFARGGHAGHSGLSGINHTKQFGITKPPKITLKRGLDSGHFPETINSQHQS
jgi:hypothetical protein